MSINWSTIEVEATVAEYFAMLHKELQGIPYNKAEHRRELVKLLRNRTEAAIERKHQNISAILIELGFAYIDGYKPLGNYQGLLQGCVSNRLEADVSIRMLLNQRICEQPSNPSVQDILASRIHVPFDRASRRYRNPAIREQQILRKGVDYIAMEARNHMLGSAGEEFVVQYERARLMYEGKKRLAKNVERVSQTRGDGLGYDILSFDQSGEERLIEVKTTAFGAYIPFFVTPNEVAVSRENEGRYHIYRVFNFRKVPKFYIRQGAIERSFKLNASQFEARLD
jgi:hypothetical protein